MRYSKHSSIACVLLSLSVVGCTVSSSAPSTTESASTANPSPAAAVAAADAPAQRAARAGATELPDCLAGTTPVEDASQGPGRICHGSLPSYFAQVMTRLTQKSPDGQGAWPTEDRSFTVVPGLGQRMDIMVGRGPWIRSFEGPDPATTVYLVTGMPCDDDSSAASVCKYGIRMKAYQVTGNAAPVDVTAQILPDAPFLNDTQRTHYDETGGGDVWLYTNKLSLAPAMRWIMEFDPDQPIPASDPHDAAGLGHFGFLVWTGQRFELKDRVSRSQWPCYPVPEGVQACISDYPEQDRFVINGK